MMKQTLKYSLFSGAIAVANGVMIAKDTFARDGHFRTDALLARAQEAGPAGDTWSAGTACSGPISGGVVIASQ